MKKQLLTLTNLIHTLTHEVPLEDLSSVHVKIFDSEGDLLGESFNLPLVIEASHQEVQGMDLFCEEAGGSVFCTIPFVFQAEDEQEYTYSWYVA